MANDTEMTNKNTTDFANTENLVEQKPEQTAADMLPKNTVLAETPKPIEPSTTENQKQTETSKQFNDRVHKKQEMLARNTGKKPTFTEAQHAVIMDIKTEQEKQSKKALELAQQKEQEEAKKTQQFNQALDQYQESKAYAEQQGLPFKQDNEFENALFQRQEQANLQRPATEVDRQIAQTPTVAEVKQQEEPVRKQVALEAAQDQVQKDRIQAIAERQAQLEEQIHNEDMQLKAIDTNRFWNSKSTGEKIMAGIGIVLAGMGSGLTGQPNAAIQVIQNAIDNDIKSQKLNNEQVLARKKHALNKVELELKKLQANTQNQLAKVKMSQMISEMQKSQTQLAQQQLMAKKLASVDGLTREEVFGLDNEMQKKMVMLSDGKFRPAVSAELAKKLNQETIPQSKDAIRGLNRLKEIMDKPAAELNQILRGESATVKQSLKGALRLELFGPGVMTDFESKMADEIIGDPTKILTFDAVEKAKLNALLKKVKQGTIDKIRQSGVAIPETKNEKMLKQFMSKNPKIKRPEAMNALIKLGYWDESADVGF